MDSASPPNVKEVQEESDEVISILSLEIPASYSKGLPGVFFELLDMDKTSKEQQQHKFTSKIICSKNISLSGNLALLGGKGGEIRLYLNIQVL